METALYNIKGEKVGKTQLPDSVFGVAWKPALVKQAIEAYLKNLRHPWAHAKGRSEVRGGGKKPWRQKGTGRARHGSIRSPLWRGGGKAHGPQKERDYSVKINKKMKRAALMSSLSRKLKDEQIKVIDAITLSKPKTKELAAVLEHILKLPRRAKKYDALIIRAPETEGLSRASANLPKTKVVPPESLNTYDVLNYKHVLIDERAVPVIERHYHVRN